MPVPPGPDVIDDCPLKGCVLREIVQVLDSTTKDKSERSVILVSSILIGQAKPFLEPDDIG